MKTLYIGFSKPKSKFKIMSHVIRFIENSLYSHVYFSWHSDKYNCDMMYEATGHGVNFCNGDIFNKKATTVSLYKLELNDNEFDKLIQYFILNCGKEYAQSQLIGLGIKMLCSHFKVKFTNFIRNGDDRFICLEIVGRALQYIKQLNDNIDMENIGLVEIEQEIAKISIKVT